MQIQHDRIRRAQELMAQHEMIGIMIMNHDDYRYFFGDTRSQPRAIIPVSGSPVFVVFEGEEPELRQALGPDAPIKVFTHVGEQIADVRKTFLSVFEGKPPTFSCSGKPKVGMQLFFDTPAFLVDLFRKVNKMVELVSSDPVMDELRMTKEPREIELLRRAQSIAAQGMKRASELLRPGVTGHEIATEVLYTMMKAGAESTSTPIYINSGIRSCWIHGKTSQHPIEAGDLVVIDLTPQYQGYCSNLARTFVVGKPSQIQLKLLTTYRQMKEATRESLKPGVTVKELDAIGEQICQDHGLAKYHLKGISHGLGLRFEETPASTIQPTHGTIPLRQKMVMTIGHTILAIPGLGGVRFEDVYLVTPDGGKILFPYPVDWDIQV